MLTLWMAYKNLPLNFFNDNMTQEFFKRIDANLKMPKKNAMREIVLNEHSKMQDKLTQILKNNNSKFSFAVDAWTAKNGSSFYGITIHFIDEKWNYRSLALDLVPSHGNHTGVDIASIFFGALRSYNIQNKVQGITLDNASANTSFIRELGILMENEKINFDVEDQHFRCFSHIMNLAVQDVLKLIKVNVDENSRNTHHESEDDDYTDESYESDEDSDDILIRSMAKIRSICKKVRNSEQLRKTLKLSC